MRVLVVWASRLGSTREIAERVAARLGERGMDCRIESAETATILAGDDAVIVGSAVYAGHWLPSALTFARSNLSTLAGRSVWLFSVGPVGGMAVRSKPVATKDVEELERMLRPREHRVFAGALDRSMVTDEDFGRVERFVARHFVPEGDYRDWDAIDRWADGIAASLGSGRGLVESGAPR